MLRRLEKRILVGLPSLPARQAMISHWLPPLNFTGRVKLQTELDYEILAKVCHIRTCSNCFGSRPKIFLNNGDGSVCKMINDNLKFGSTFYILSASFIMYLFPCPSFYTRKRMCIHHLLPVLFFSCSRRWKVTPALTSDWSARRPP